MFKNSSQLIEFLTEVDLIYDLSNIIIIIHIFFPIFLIESFFFFLFFFPSNILFIFMYYKSKHSIHCTRFFLTIPHGSEAELGNMDKKRRKIGDMK